jgi:hypothetical protein
MVKLKINDWQTVKITKQSKKKDKKLKLKLKTTP